MSKKRIVHPTEGMIISDAFLWGIDENNKCIFKVNYEEQTAEYIHYIGDDGIADLPCFFGVQKSGSKLVLSPAYQNERCYIGVFDIDVQKLKKIVLKDLPITDDTKSWCRFYYYSYRYKDYVFFIGRTYPAIIKYSLIDDSVEYYTEFMDYLLHEKRNAEACYFLGDAFIEDDFLYIASAQIKGVFKIDCRTGKTEYSCIETEAEGLMSITKVGTGKMAISCWGKNSDCMLLWDYKNNILENSIKLPNMSSGAVGHTYMVYNDRYLIAFSRAVLDEQGKRKLSVIRIDLNTMEMDDLHVLDDFQADANMGESDFVFAQYYGEKLMFVTNGDWQWHEYDMNTKEITRFFVYQDDDYMFNMCHDRIYDKNEKNVLFAEKDVDVNCFISAI